MACCPRCDNELPPAPVYPGDAENVRLNEAYELARRLYRLKNPHRDLKAEADADEDGRPTKNSGANIEDM
jgi:hypothetical protein